MSTDKPINNALGRHILSAAGFLFLGGIAWGSLSQSVNSLEDETKKTNTRVDRIEDRVRNNSEKLSAVDERTKLILDMVNEINRKIPVKDNR